MEKSRQRNAVIDAIRTIFAFIIMMYHFYSNGKKHFPGGGLGVEVFCVIAGFLFFLAYDKRKVASFDIDQRFDYLKSHTARRFLRFLGYSVASYIMIFAVTHIWQNHDITSFKGFCDILAGDIWEIFLVEMGGFNHGIVTRNGAIWTMSSIFLVEFFILGMLVIYGKKYLHFWLPVSVLCGCGWYLNVRQGAQYVFQGFTTVGNIRVYLAMSCGIWAVFLYKKLISYKFRKLGTASLTLVEMMCYGLDIYACFVRGGAFSPFCVMVLTAIAISITFSRKSYSAIFSEGNKMTDNLGEYSLCLYISHPAVLIYFQQLYGHADELWRHKFAFLAVSLLIAMLCMLLLKEIYSLAPKIVKKVKEIVVVS